MSSNTPIDITQDTPKSSSKQVPGRTPGTTMLPLARIKRVIKEDKDVALINAEATFCIAYATELFMEYLVTEAFSRAKKEKRKTVYYKDLASTVKESDQLEFLVDVIPTTMTLKEAMAKRKENLSDETESSSPTPAKKQKTSNKSNAKSDATDTRNTSAPPTSTIKAAAAESIDENTITLDENDETNSQGEEDDNIEQGEDEAQVETENTAVTTETQDDVDQDDLMMEEDPKQD
ncbi:histone-fold-containing protein [Parasitella parasitica]|nr:histone-fold-containing protein [Parasitella parasitica]